MGQSGSFHLFTQESTRDPREVLASVLGLTGASTISFAARTSRRDRRIGRVLRRLIGALEASDPGEDSDNLQLVGTRTALADVPGLYVPGSCLEVNMGATPLGDAIAASIRDEITEGIRGDFVPAEIVFRLGRHDLSGMVDDTHEFVRENVAFTCTLFGYSTPRDWAQMRRHLPRVSAINTLRDDLRNAVGPLEECLVFSA